MSGGDIYNWEKIRLADQVKRAEDAVLALMDERGIDVIFERDGATALVDLSAARLREHLRLLREEGAR